MQKYILYRTIVQIFEILNFIKLSPFFLKSTIFIMNFQFFPINFFIFKSKNLKLCIQIHKDVTYQINGGDFKNFNF